MNFSSKWFDRKRQVALSIGVLCLLSIIAHTEIWRVGYYPGWEQASMPASNIDFTTLTHVIHFSVVPNTNGTLDSSANGISTANSADVVLQAHAAGRKVLICVGGGDTESLFQEATSAANLPVFIKQPHEFHGDAWL